MNAGEIVSSVIGAIACGLLTWIARRLARIGIEFHRFMAEHVWLIATTLWNRDKVIRIMDQLGMPVNDVPPDQPGR